MKKTKLVEGVDSIGLGDESQLLAVSSSAIFTKEFAEYQAQWFFEASRDFFGWMGSDEILYTVNAQNVKPEFISNGTTTICINPITDFSTSTTSLTIPTGTNIDLVSTTAEVIRTNTTPGLLKSSIKLNRLNENWALYRNCGTKSDLLLLSDGVDCSPTIDNYSIQQEIFFKNSSTNWALEFADISQPDLIRLETTSDFILIVNSSAELLNYTIAQLQYGTLSQEIKCYTDKTVSTQSYSDIIAIEFPGVELGTSVKSYGTESIDSWTAPTRYNHVFLTQSHGTKDRLVVAGFTISDYIDLIDLIQTGTSSESSNTPTEQSSKPQIGISIRESWITII